MRSTDNQLREIMKRADHMKEKESAKKVVFFYALSACACILLMAVTVRHLPVVPSSGMSQASGHYGSLLLNASYMGYVVIGILAFLLGVSVTLLCLRFRKFSEMEREST